VCCPNASTRAPDAFALAMAASVSKARSCTLITTMSGFRESAPSSRAGGDTVKML
jgi:hypothetical protein